MRCSAQDMQEAECSQTWNWGHRCKSLRLRSLQNPIRRPYACEIAISDPEIGNPSPGFTSSNLGCTVMHPSKNNLRNLLPDRRWLERNPPTLNCVVRARFVRIAEKSVNRRFEVDRRSESRGRFKFHHCVRIL
jgi:hypothetical protein